jgi:hypothetical protein
VIILLCLIFFGFLQVGILYNHERVLQFASFASARSATVGFDPDIYNRAYRVGAIAASGQMLAPGQGQSPKDQLVTELITIPLYQFRTQNMDYEYWDRYGMMANIQLNAPSARMLREQNPQRHPLDMPLAAAFYPRDSSGNVVITMRGQPDDRTDMAWHYQHYLQ